jgi:hypothetical protein
MKITMLRNPARSLGCKLAEGQTGDVDAETGKRMIDLGIAEPVVDSKPEPKAPSKFDEKK